MVALLGKKGAFTNWSLLVPFIIGLLLCWRFIAYPSSTPSMDATSGRTYPKLKIKEQILEQLRLNGTSSCHHVRTHNAMVLMDPFLPKQNKSSEAPPFMLDIGSTFSFMLVSVTENGTARCAGGDYYETELVGEHWRSRPTVTDHGNGSYTVTLVMDAIEFPGIYNLTVYLLFDNFHGLDKDPGVWRIKKDVVRMQFEYRSRAGSSSKPNALPVCGASDMQELKGGRWRRGWYNKTCEADNEGRYRWCLGEGHEECKRWQCEGRVSRLESNGWVYSSERCKFRLWEAAEAWNCLSGKWMVLWGDSNMQDMLRNLLLFVLDYPLPPGATMSDWYIDPFVERFFINPRRPDEALHVSIIPNQPYDIRNETYKNWLSLHFKGSQFPDFLIINPALDDGRYEHLSIEEFLVNVDEGFRFWEAVLDGEGKGTTVFVRSGVAPAGEAGNPQKVEVLNALAMERMGGLNGEHVSRMDAFEASFPFHYGNGWSDGGHYGRAPKYGAWPWLGQPHHYFVEIMLTHMMLHALC